MLSLEQHHAYACRAVTRRYKNDGVRGEIKMARISFKKIIIISASSLLMILLLSSCTDITASESRFNDAKWTLIGPYSEPDRESCPLFYEDLLSDYGGESVVSETGLPEGIKNTRVVNARNGKVDLAGAYNGKSWAVAYAYLEFEGNGEECFFRMGSDDGLRVWINGTLAVDDHSHRALEPNSNSFGTVLKKGTNRILVKVCQGEQGWEFSIKDTTRAEHADFLSGSGRIGLSVSTRSHFLSDDEDITFAVYANPAPLTDIPYSYRVTGPNGDTVASGNGSLGESITVPLPPAKEEYYKLWVEPGEVVDAIVKEKLGHNKTACVFFIGDPISVMTSYSSKARRAAEELDSMASRPGPGEDLHKYTTDIVPALLYMADIIDKKVTGITVTEDKQLSYVMYINDIIDVLETEPQALLYLTGYRQMAYRSDIDNSIQPYSLYLPESYSPDKKYSLAVMLHGYSENDYDFGIKLASLLPEDFIIVSVFGRGDLYYQSAGEQDVIDVIDRIMSRYSVDENRVYLMGSSMGGLGTWRIGTLYSDRFAAIAPFCGWYGYDLLENLGNMKTYIVHGNADDVVPIKFEKNCAERLQKLGYDVTFIEIANGSHNAWSEWAGLYPPETILEIFRSVQRDPSPARLAAVIPQVRYGRHYWITVDELDTSGALTMPEYTSRTPYDSFYPLHPAPGRFKAERSYDGSVTIVTERINALSIDLKTAGTGSTTIKKVTIDGASLEVPSNADVLHLVKKKDNMWEIDGSYGAKAFAAHEGGGIADLFAKPLLIVYGTQDPNTAQVLLEAAKSLADWSSIPEFPIGMKTGIYMVKSDKEVAADDLSAYNLILLGNPGENLISARISRALEPYYTGGAISVDGKTYSQNGLCVTLPNPEARDRIIGYIDCTRFLTSSGAAKRYFFEFQFRLRNSYINELMGYPAFCPDVFVMTANPFKDEWAGWFDRNWENLQGRAVR